MNRLAAYLLLFVPYTLLVRRFWFTTDDAYISFRFARNLALGHGLRYNLGDHTPVEGYSNFLWVLLCAVFERLGLDITLWPCLVSAACGYVLLWLVLDRMVRRLDVEPVPAALGALTLAVFPPFAVWSTSGLATLPFALLIFLVFDRLVLRERPDPIGGGLAALALALIRVEGIAWGSVLLVMAALVHRRRLRPLLVAAGILVAGYAVYSGWRLGHHGHLLPNTAQAKLGASTLVEGWVRGGRYVMTHFLTFLTPFLLIPATVLAVRRRRPAAIPVASMAWAFPAYAVAVTGDFMAMGRFLVPAFAFHTVLFAWMIQDLSGRAAVRTVAATAMALVAVLPAWNVHLVPESVRVKFHTRPAKGFKSEREYYDFQSGNVAVWTTEGKALRRYVDTRSFPNPNPACVTGSLGCLGYYSNLPLLDVMGLVTPEVAARAPSRPPLQSFPGHDRVVSPLFFLDRRPEILDFHLMRKADPRLIQLRCANVERSFGEEGDKVDLARRYVVDFADVTDPDAPDKPLVLVTWRRIEDDPDEAWATHRARLDSLRTASRTPR